MTSEWLHLPVQHKDRPVPDRHAERIQRITRIFRGGRPLKWYDYLYHLLKSGDLLTFDQWLNFDDANFGETDDYEMAGPAPPDPPRRKDAFNLDAVDGW